MVTSHRERVTHQLHRALGPDKDSPPKTTSRRPRKKSKKPPLPPKQASSETKEPSAPEIELFPDEEDPFFQEASTYVGDVCDSGDELENSYAGIVLSRHSHEDGAGAQADRIHEDGDSPAELEELPADQPEPEERTTGPGTPVSPQPGDWGTSSPEPELPTPETATRPQLPDKEAVRKRGRANNVRR